MNERIKRIQLSRRNEIRAVDWFRTNRERLHESRPYFTEVAEELSAHLSEGQEAKIEVTITNVKNLANDLDMLWKPEKKVAAKPVKQSRQEKKAIYRKQFNSRTGSLEGRMDRIEGMLTTLFAELNVQQPPPAPGPGETPPKPPISGEQFASPPKGESARKVLAELRNRNISALGGK